MARSRATIAANIAQQMLDADASTAVSHGPFFDLAIRPVSTELASAEAATDRLSTIYSRLANNPLSLTDSEVVALGKNFRVPMPQGTKAVTLITFYLTSLPTGEIVIPANTPVASVDGIYVYTTDNAVSGITAVNAPAYYDASTGRYNVQVQATAMAIGPAFNLPAYRITRLLSSIPGIAGVYNSVPAQGGSSPDQSINYLSQIQAAFFGRDTSSVAGLSVDLVRRGLNQQVLFVASDSRDAFVRPVAGPAVDVYMMQPNEVLTEDVFLASSLNRYMLSKQPVLSLLSVYVNNTLLDSGSWTLVTDTSPAYRNSCLAKTYVTLATSLSNGDNLRIRYTYASACWDLYQGLQDQDVMGTDILPRLTNPLYVTIVAEVTAKDTLMASIRSSISAYMLDNFMTQLAPQDVSTYLQSVYPEIKAIKWRAFCRANDTGVYSIQVPAGLSPMFKTVSDLQVSGATL